MEQKSQGILLSTIPYLGQQKIIKVFTSDVGLLSFFVRSTKLSSLTSPFCFGEWVYRKSDKEIFPLVDGTLLDPFSHLRTSYEAILAAGSIAKDLLRSQLPLKPSPSLHELLLAYFRRLEISPQPHILAISFRLKLLLHEGHLSLAQETHIPFDSTEWETLLHLTYSRQFTQIENQPLSRGFSEKTVRLFEEKMS